MAVIISAEDARKYTKAPLYLQCRTMQEIIIENTPEIDSVQVADHLGYQVDDAGNLGYWIERGNSYFGTEVNDLYDMQILYLKKARQWKITIGIDHHDVHSCKLRGQRMAVPIAIPDIINLHFQFACQAENQCIESLLAIDLGNTRSCALLCEDIRDVARRGCMQIHKLPLYSYTDSKIADTGVFDSFVSFAQASGLSFTRIGKEAIPVANNLRGLKASGDFYLSSPKRYFWDFDENLNGWQIYDGDKGSVLPNKVPAAEKLASMLHTANTDTLPRAAILSSMLLELLEQAEAYLNGPAFYAVNSLPKIVSHVCVTFPAGWSDTERKLYQEVLQHAVSLYQGSRCDSSMPITLDVSCDEATAVLLCYVYGEIAKYSGCADAWLRAIGRTSLANQEETHARVAVIDVGGGTSDLVIVNIQNRKSETGLNLQIDKLYKDGTNKAGDLLLQKVTERILVEKIAAGTIAASAPKNIKAAYIADFSKYLNTLIADPNVRQLTRRFWFPLAIEFISALKQGKTRIGLPDSFRLLHDIITEHPEWTGNNVNEDFSMITITPEDQRLFERIVTQTFRDSAKLFGAAIYAFDADLVILAGKTTETDQVSQVFRKYCCLPESRFIPMWNYMIGDWCTVADAGRIHDSKYTTAIGAVIYAVINQHFPIQALEAAVQTRNAQGLNEGNYLWGIANNGYFFAADAILKQGSNECWVPFSGHPKLIARRRFAVDASEIAISYELRIKPFQKRSMEWETLCRNYLPYMAENFSIRCEDPGIRPENFLVVRKNTRPLHSQKISVTVGIDAMDDTRTRLAVTAVDGMYEDGSPVSVQDLSLYQKPQARCIGRGFNVKLHLQTDSNARATITIAEVNGKYADGSLVGKEDLEIRIRTSGEDLFWLDSGKI